MKLGVSGDASMSNNSTDKPYGPDSGQVGNIQNLKYLHRANLETDKQIQKYT